MADIGYGIAFGVEPTVGAGTYTALAEVFSAVPPDAVVDQVETTHYASPGRRREYIPALTDSGEVAIQMNYEPGSATDLFVNAWQLDGTTRECELEFANGVVILFDAFVLNYTKATPLDDRMTATLNLKVTGQPTQTPAP